MTVAQAASASQTNHVHQLDLRTLGTADLAKRELEREKSRREAPSDSALARQQLVERIAQCSADPSERKMAALHAAWGAALAGEDYWPYLCLLHWARLEEITADAERLGVHTRFESSPADREAIAVRLVSGWSGR